MIQFLRKPCPTVLCDDDVGVGAAVLVDVLHGPLHAIHHLHAALQIAVLGPQRLGLRRTEGQVGSEARAGVDLYLRSRNSRWRWITVSHLKASSGGGCAGESCG